MYYGFMCNLLKNYIKGFRVYTLGLKFLILSIKFLNLWNHFNLKYLSSPLFIYVILDSNAAKKNEKLLIKLYFT